MAWRFRLLIQREFQQRGYGSEAATLLEKHLLSYAEITQIGLAVLVRNAPASTFWEKRGYVQGVPCSDNHDNDVYKYHLPRPASG